MGQLSTRTVTTKAPQERKQKKKANAEEDGEVTGGERANRAKKGKKREISPPEAMPESSRTCSAHSTLASKRRLSASYSYLCRPTDRPTARMESKAEWTWPFFLEKIKNKRKDTVTKQWESRNAYKNPRKIRSTKRRKEVKSVNGMTLRENFLPLMSGEEEKCLKGFDKNPRVGLWGG